MFCKNCHNEIDNPAPRQLYCNYFCRSAFGIKKYKKTRIKRIYVKTKRENPHFACQRCGYKWKLNFDPLREHDKLKDLICPKCNKKTA